jgi:hypothetical protein
MIFLLDFGSVPSVWYLFFYYYIEHYMCFVAMLFLREYNTPLYRQLKPTIHVHSTIGHVLLYIKYLTQG